ncbi:MAG: hypothetical protein K1X53_17435 [Candidatus Sumerlaeaceae bacterium]|nr:hypothetical protein [Candidatus Sumerlaeaceae bacterium]
MPDNVNVRQSDAWLDRSGPQESVVVSSRARYARNLPHVPFPMRARPAELRGVAEVVEAAVNNTGVFSSGLRVDLGDTPAVDRTYLKENLLISTEMEKGGENRFAYFSPDIRLGLMVNEEDHLRMFALEPGYQPHEALRAVIELETQLNRRLHFAYSPRYGFLTACPTNTGTGLRASVLMHLPGLAMTRKTGDIMKSMPQLGLTARGIHGENSAHLGDFFQVSNEFTLGKSEDEILQTVVTVVEQIIKGEEQARQGLYQQNRTVVEDEVWRAWGLLTNARVITSNEAVQLLSKLRFGIDQGFLKDLTHRELNRLVIDVHPGHLQYDSAEAEDSAVRDRLRAELLRRRLLKKSGEN